MSKEEEREDRLHIVQRKSVPLYMDPNKAPEDIFQDLLHIDSTLRAFSPDQHTTETWRELSKECNLRMIRTLYASTAPHARQLIHMLAFLYKRRSEQGIQHGAT